MSVDKIDNMLLFLTKPKEFLLNKEILLYHGTPVNINKHYLDPLAVNVGATKFSKLRWSTYFWDNRNSALKWALSRSIEPNVPEEKYETLYKNEHDKILICKRNSTNINIEDEIVNRKIYTYIYVVKVPAKIVEVGSSNDINEFTVSQPIKIYKKEKILLTRKIFREFFKIVTEEEFNLVLNNFKAYVQNAPKVRGIFLNNILDNKRDAYRNEVLKEIDSGKLKVSDDISHLRKKVNDAYKNDLYGLK